MLEHLWGQVRLGWLLISARKRREMLSLIRKLKRQERLPDASSLSADHQQLVQRIRQTTATLNRNNLSRTEAYLSFYRNHPEVHWALLAHAVSRNAGYGMTDVRGEWFTRISKQDDPDQFFAFLERANWLIFNDAYPQLMLFEEGRRREQNLSSLLPVFGVSHFMCTIWNDFWESPEPSLLTRALIINEQNYIESRVVQNETYKHSVLSSIQFQAQSLLNLTLVLCPHEAGRETRVAGCAVEDFTSLDDRIQTGLKLYQILYQDRIRHQAMLDWLSNRAHTASRADYWPKHFSSSAGDGMESTANYEPKFLTNAKRKRRIYSPKLADVWSDVDHQPAEPGDWFVDLAYVRYLFEPIQKQELDFTSEYVASLQTIERMLVAKQALGL